MGSSLVVLWLRVRLAMQGVRVRFLVREIRSHIQYCNTFNEGFKNGPHKRNLFFFFKENLIEQGASSMELTQPLLVTQSPSPWQQEVSGKWTKADPATPPCQSHPSFFSFHSLILVWLFSSWLKDNCYTSLHWVGNPAKGKGKRQNGKGHPN